MCSINCIVSPPPSNEAGKFGNGVVVNSRGGSSTNFNSGCIVVVVVVKVAIAPTPPPPPVDEESNISVPSTMFILFLDFSSHTLRKTVAYSRAKGK